jgi:tyrosine-specific transport protein
LILFIIWFFLPKLDFSNLVLFNSADLFLPYGVALFSLVGWSAIPEMIDIFKTSEEKKKIKKVIIVSTIVVVTLYILFSMAVLGITGGNPSPDTLSGLAPFLDSRIIMLLTLAGVITLADSFLVLGLYFRNTFVHDFKMSKTLASLIACGLPMVLFLIGFRSFIDVIGFVGTVLGAVEGVLLLLIFRKAKVLGQRTPEYSLKVPSALVYFIILMFVLGAIFEFVL